MKISNCIMPSSLYKIGFKDASKNKFIRLNPMYFYKNRPLIFLKVNIELNNVPEELTKREDFYTFLLSGFITI